MTRLQQYEYHAASQRFGDLKKRLAQYIERVETGIKSNPRCFFKFSNLKRNSSGYPSAVFQEIADLLGEYSQGVYVRDNSQEDFVVTGGVEDSSTALLIQLEEETIERNIVALDTQNGPGPDGISPLILKKIVLVVKKPLAVLFNLPLLSGIFPCVWKESYVQEW
jgi:hypothetical protein